MYTPHSWPQRRWACAASRRSSVLCRYAHGPRVDCGACVGRRLPEGGGKSKSSRDSASTPPQKPAPATGCCFSKPRGLGRCDRTPTILIDSTRVSPEHASVMRNLAYLTAGGIVCVLRAQVVALREKVRTLFGRLLRRKLEQERSCRAEQREPWRWRR